MAIRITDLIQRVPTSVEQLVRRVRDQARPVLQEALRTECRLMMRTPEEIEQKKSGAQVPIEVLPGYPAILEPVSFPDDFEVILLLSRYRTLLEQAHKGALGLLPLLNELLRRPDAERWIGGVKDLELRSVGNWAASLLERLNAYEPLKTILAVEEDILGVYRYDADIFADDYAVNKASIEVYWGVIGLAAEWLPCTVEDLTIVVLAHELAHAYTQLGADIDRKRWPSQVFARTEKSLKEGLAQYYTDRVLRRLEFRYKGALAAYEKLLAHQPPPYRVHEPWLEKFSPESVRRAMIEVRRWKETAVAKFGERLGAAQKGLHPDIGL